MRLLVCGGRNFSDRLLMRMILDQIDSTSGIEVLIHGAAQGADRLAADWAKERGIPGLPFPADWKKYGNSAGPIRNARMLKEGRPDFVVAFPGGDGTLDMVTRARVSLGSDKVRVII